MLHKRDNTQTTLTLIILMEKESITNAKDKHDKEMWMSKSENPYQINGDDLRLNKMCC